MPGSTRTPYIPQAESFLQVSGRCQESFVRPVDIIVTVQISIISGSVLLPDMTRLSGRPVVIDRLMLDTWQAMLFDAATNSRYKDGAFEDLLQRDTPALQAVDTYLDSTLLTKRERAIFEQIRVLIGDVATEQSEDTHTVLRQKFVKMVSEDTNLQMSDQHPKRSDAVIDSVHWTFDGQR